MTEETSSSDSEQLSRRRFLALLTHGGWVAAMGVLVYQMGRFVGARDLQSSPKPVVVAGKLAEFPPGSTTYVSDARAWVENENGNLKAIDAVCTHMGCLVQKRETAVPGFQCPCHGSEYGEDGRVEKGPAERPLRHLSVETTANDIVVIRT